MWAVHGWTRQPNFAGKTVVGGRVMGARERRRGAAAERELAAILSDWLGVAIKRNLGQSREGRRRHRTAACGGKSSGTSVCK